MCDRVIEKYQNICEKFGMNNDEIIERQEITRKAREIASPENDWSHLQQIKSNTHGLTLMRWQAKACTPLSKKMDTCQFCDAKNIKWGHYIKC